MFNHTKPKKCSFICSKRILILKSSIKCAWSILYTQTKCTLNGLLVFLGKLWWNDNLAFQSHYKINWKSSLAHLKYNFNSKSLRISRYTILFSLFCSYLSILLLHFISMFALFNRDFILWAFCSIFLLRKDMRSHKTKL